MDKQALSSDRLTNAEADKGSVDLFAAPLRLLFDSFAA
jgi:hypothetical protein